MRCFCRVSAWGLCEFRPSWNGGSLCGGDVSPRSTRDDDERDDARSPRPSELCAHARRDASLESSPTHQQGAPHPLSVPRRRSTEAIARRTETPSDAVAFLFFSREAIGNAVVPISVGRTLPVADNTVFLATRAAHWRLVAGRLGLALIALGFLSGQRGTDVACRAILVGNSRASRSARPSLLPVVSSSVCDHGDSDPDRRIILLEATHCSTPSWPSTARHIAQIATRAASSGAREVTQFVTAGPYRILIPPRRPRSFFARHGSASAADRRHGALLNPYPVGATFPVLLQTQDPADRFWSAIRPFPVLWLY